MIAVVLIGIIIFLWWIGKDGTGQHVEVNKDTIYNSKNNIDEEEFTKTKIEESKKKENLIISELDLPTVATWENHLKINGNIVPTSENRKVPYFSIDTSKKKKPKIDPNSPWGKLRKQVLERDGYTCQGYKCNSKKNLSVHHIVPVSLGGRNNLTNLITLCLECHEKTHNNNFTSRKIKGNLNNYGNDVQLSKKIILLSDAIDGQQNVEIDYISFDKKTSHRVIRPNSIAYGDHNLKIYVYAYCYMRNALRTFRISKISNIKKVK